MSLKKNIIAFAVISLLGTLSHFVYEWSGNNSLVGAFFPVNESTWEHLKLLFFPTLIFSAIEYIISKEKPKNYIPAVVISVLCGMLSIVTLFYTLSGIIGKNVDFINILIYYIGVIIMLCKKRKIIMEEKYSFGITRHIAIAAAALITVLFILWSYNPPTLGIFLPPVAI